MTGPLDCSGIVQCNGDHNGGHWAVNGSRCPLETAAALYLWRPSDMSFWRPAGPFVINQNLTVEPAQ
jgi:hypothetical protein